MAFRRKRSFFRGRRGVARPSSQKWIGCHQTQFLNASNLDPLTPGTYETGLAFIPLVSATDYGTQDAGVVLSDDNRQERVKVVRTVGHFSLLNLNQASENSDLMATEVFWYFAALKRDEVTNAEALDAASGVGVGTDAYNPGVQEGPALWRQPVKRFGMTARVQGMSEVGGALGSYQETSERSWDFRPRCPMQTPDEWYLVVGVNLFTLTPAFPADVPFMLIVMARTLIQD